MPVVGWRWIGATAAAGALGAVSMLAQILLVSGHGRLFSDVEISFGAAAGTGALIGAVLALPGALERRLLHPSFGFWVMFFFGSVDWLGDLEGLHRWLLQSVILALLLASAFRLRNAGLVPGVLSGAALATLVAVPMSILVWKNVFVASGGEWRLENPEFSRWITRKARRLDATTDAGQLPDIWLVVADQYPSIAEAIRRQVPYPELELARLRERGWRIREDAWTDVPNTAITLAHAFSLSTQLTNGGRRALATADRMVRLFEKGALGWERSFSRPLVLTTLEKAGYDTRGWLGWWLVSHYIPFRHVDKFRHRSLDSLHQASVAVWFRIHWGGWATEPEDEDFILAEYFRGFERNCREIETQRERFFAFAPSEDMQRSPLFVFYDLFWLHDGVNMDASGACQVDGSDIFDLPRDDGSRWIAFCKELQERGETVLGWAPGCLPQHIRDERAGRLIEYLPVFLGRLELHAKEVAGNRPFRILVMADEGMPYRHGGAEPQGPHAWRSGSWDKHPAVFRAEFGKGVSRLWPEEEIPDIPQAVRAVVLDLVRRDRSNLSTGQDAPAPMEEEILPRFLSDSDGGS